MVFIERFKKLPTWTLFCHLLAKMVIGMGIGILLAPYLDGYAWWIILAAFVLALPAKLKMIEVYRTMPTNTIMLAVFAGILFGIGIGLLFISHLQPYGWWVLLAGVILSAPGAYRILTHT
jgi:uncharacterized membrane-anchored protein YitT (DUF2179 family)